MDVGGGGLGGASERVVHAAAAWMPDALIVDGLAPGLGTSTWTTPRTSRSTRGETVEECFAWAAVVCSTT